MSAHTGNAVNGANASFGANACAAGNKVACNDSDLTHSSAHEASHIIQQSTASKLKND